VWQHSFLDWTDVLVQGVLNPLHRGQPVRFRPAAWSEHSREGAIEIPECCDLVIIEGVGAARRELTPFVDVAIWVQSDMPEAKRRGIARDGGDENAVTFWRQWMAEELPYMAQQRPWERAAVVVAGTLQLPHDPVREVVIAPGLDHDLNRGQ
jgi:hypothetical protein